MAYQARLEMRIFVVCVNARSKSPIKDIEGRVRQKAKATSTTRLRKRGSENDSHGYRGRSQKEEMEMNGGIGGCCRCLNFHTIGQEEGLKKRTGFKIEMSVGRGEGGSVKNSVPKSNKVSRGASSCKS
jgi:hypothetical protein